MLRPRPGAPALERVEQQPEQSEKRRHILKPRALGAEGETQHRTEGRRDPFRRRVPGQGLPVLLDHQGIAGQRDDRRRDAGQQAAEQYPPAPPVQ